MNEDFKIDLETYCNDLEFFKKVKAEKKPNNFEIYSGFNFKDLYFVIKPGYDKSLLSIKRLNNILHIEYPDLEPITHILTPISLISFINYDFRCVNIGIIDKPKTTKVVYK